VAPGGHGLGDRFGLDQDRQDDATARERTEVTGWGY